MHVKQRDYIVRKTGNNENLVKTHYLKPTNRLFWIAPIKFSE